MNGTKIQLLIISGTEKIKSTSDIIIDHIMNKLKNVEVKVIRLREYVIKDCGICGNCNNNTTNCSINDDMPKIINEMLWADAIIYITPVHGFGMAHLMQNFIERAGVGYLRFNRPLKNKIGGCIVVGRKYNLGNVHDQIINNFILNRMIIPGAGFPALFHSGNSGVLEDDLEGIVAIESMIDRVIEFAGITKNIKSIRNITIANERELLQSKELYIRRS